MTKRIALTTVAMAIALAAGCTQSPSTTASGSSGAASPAPTASTSQQATDSDRAFIDLMSMHHQMAMMDADEALSKATHAELKTFAQKLKDSQSSEMNQMKTWRQQWFGSGDVPAPDMGMMVSIDPGEKFDKVWMMRMITHHQGAIDMSKLMLTVPGRAETKTLAQSIIDAQEKDQEQMRSWIRTWYGE